MPDPEPVFTFGRGMRIEKLYPSWWRRKLNAFRMWLTEIGL